MKSIPHTFCNLDRDAIGVFRSEAGTLTRLPRRSTVTVRSAATAEKSTKTERTQLGDSGLEVNKLCIGAWSWNDRSGYWGQNSHGNYTDQDIREAWDGLLEEGLDFIDTAEVYGFGQSEEFIAEQMKRTGAKPIIATKFAPLPFRFTADNVVKTIKGSLSRLQKDQVDLYQIHWPGFPFANNWSTNRFVEGLARVKTAGLTKAVGVSNFKAERVREANSILRDKGVPLASNQVQYSLLYRAPERNGVIQACKETGTAMLAYSPLTQGLLSGKYTLENKPGGPRAGVFSDDKIKQIQPLLRQLKEIGDARQKSQVQVAVNWIISKGEQEGFNVVPILGVKTREQAKEAKGVLGWRLSSDEVKSLDQTSSPLQKDELGAPFESW